MFASHSKKPEVSAATNSIKTAADAFVEPVKTHFPMQKEIRNARQKQL